MTTKQCFLVISLLLTLDFFSGSGQPYQYYEEVLIDLPKKVLLINEKIDIGLLVVEKYTRQPSLLSAYAFADVVDAEGKSFARGKIPLSNGKGFGQLYLASNTPTGTYTLVVYTNWMKNQSAAAQAIVPLTIINPQAITIVTYDSVSAKRLYKIRWAERAQNPIPHQMTTLKFFACDSLSRPYKGKFNLIDADNNKRNELCTNSNGIGFINYVPEPDIQYHLISAENDSLVFDLPVAKISNGRLVISEVSDKQYKVRIFKYPQLKTNYFLRFESGNLPYFQTPLFSFSDSISFDYYYDQLPLSLTDIRLINEFGETLDMITVRKKRAEIPSPIVSVEHKNYAAGDTMRISVSFPPGINSLPNMFSVSVIPAISYSWSNQLSLPSQVCEVKLSTPVSTGNLPELEGHILHGMLLSSLGKPAANETVYISLPGQVPYVRQTTTQNDGSFVFNLPDGFLGQTLRISVPTEDSTLKVNVRPSFVQLSDLPTYAPMALTPERLSFAKEMYKWNAIEEAFNNPINSSDSDLPFYGYPDKIYFLDHFQKLPAFEEMIFEIVKNVVVQKNSKGRTLGVIESEKNRIIGENPGIFIDGQWLCDHNQLFTILPAQVDRIEIVFRKYYFGNVAMDGIVNIVTREGVYLDEKNVLAVHELLDGTLAVRNTNQGLFRTTQYWEPFVPINADGKYEIKFVVSNVPGQYVVRVNTFSEGERASSVVDYITVTSN